MSYGNVKQSTIDGLRRHAEHGTPTGDFLYAVLTNNLRGAFERGDDENLAALREIVQFCYWELPSECWGSVENVEAWQRHCAELRTTKAAEAGADEP